MQTKAGNVVGDGDLGHRVSSTTRTYSQEIGFGKTACLIGTGKNKGNLNLWGMSRGCWRWREHTAKVWGVGLGAGPHLHKNELQLVLDTTF